MRGSDLRRYSLAHVIGAVVGLTVVAGVIGYNLQRQRTADIATAKAWDITGPPCVQLTQAQWDARRLKTRSVFDYDRTKLGRWSGDASCSDVKTDGGRGFGTDKVCQFTNPTVLTVVSPAGSFFFDTGIGQPATLSIHKDVPKCMLASTFTRRTERQEWYDPLAARRLFPR